MKLRKAIEMLDSVHKLMVLYSDKGGKDNEILDAVRTAVLGLTMLEKELGNISFIDNQTTEKADKKFTKDPTQVDNPDGDGTIEV